MRTPGEGGLERIGQIWYYTFYNLNGKQVRRSSKSPLKSVALEMLLRAQAELRKGTEPTATRKLHTRTCGKSCSTITRTGAGSSWAAKIRLSPDVVAI